MNRNDVAKLLYTEISYIYSQNLAKPRKTYWNKMATVMPSKKAEETYQNVGNLRPAEEIGEEGQMPYGKITDGLETTVINKKYGNGLKFSFEAWDDEKHGIIKKAKSAEIHRTIMTLRERNIAAIWNTVTTATGADAVAFASASHPLLNTDGDLNDNLVSGEFNPTNYKAAVDSFDEWLNHAGEDFDTSCDKMYAHPTRQMYIFEMLMSTLKAFEISNTKNFLPKVTPVFNKYLSKLPVHLIDSSIPTCIMQKRLAISAGYAVDERDNQMFYFNLYERYRAAMINPGFGFVTITGAA